MPLDEATLMKMLEPLVVELEELRAELAVLKAARPPDLGPIVLDLETLRAGLAELRTYRLDAPAWSAGVHRQGSVVQHFHGQYFEAVVDTVAEPGDGIAWRRLGLHGFRYRGLFMEGAEYEAGDLVMKEGSMMFQTAAGRLEWLSLRGRKGHRGDPGPAGDPGAPGAAGANGEPGKPGAALIRLEAEGGVLFAVMSDGRRDPVWREAVSLNGGEGR